MIGIYGNKEGDIIFCRINNKIVKVKIAKVYQRQPYIGMLYVEFVENPGVFTHITISDIVVEVEAEQRGQGSIMTSDEPIAFHLEAMNRAWKLYDDIVEHRVRFATPIEQWIAQNKAANDFDEHRAWLEEQHVNLEYDKKQREYKLLYWLP